MMKVLRSCQSHSRNRAHSLPRTKGQAVCYVHQEGGSFSLRTVSTGSDGSRQTAFHSVSERDHHCTGHRRRWCLSHHVSTWTCAGDETNQRSSNRERMRMWSSRFEVVLPNARDKHYTKLMRTLTQTHFFIPSSFGIMLLEFSQ